jgi:hypothetical protein
LGKQLLGGMLQSGKNEGQERAEREECQWDPNEVGTSDNEKGSLKAKQHLLLQNINENND